MVNKCVRIAFHQKYLEAFRCHGDNIAELKLRGLTREASIMAWQAPTVDTPTITRIFATRKAMVSFALYDVEIGIAVSANNII